ncbi:hypothetical protein YC2023_093517 [Brassica napus]
MSIELLDISQLFRLNMLTYCWSPVPNEKEENTQQEPAEESTNFGNNSLKLSNKK